MRESAGVSVSIFLEGILTEFCEMMWPADFYQTEINVGRFTKWFWGRGHDHIIILLLGHNQTNIL